MRTIRSFRVPPETGGAGQCVERGAYAGCARAGSDLGGGAVIENLALMQDDDIVAGLDLVDQMRCPKHANALARDKAPDMLEDVRAGLDIEAGGPLVNQDG